MSVTITTPSLSWNWPDVKRPEFDQAMKPKTIVLLLFCLMPLALGVSGQSQFSIIPKPHYLAAGEGKFALDKNTKIETPDDNRSREIAAFLRDAIKEQTGIALSNKKKSKNSIVFQFVKNVQGDEAYRLTVAPKLITIEASNTKGFFWAVQTLRQMLPLDKSPVVTIPGVTIDDRPEFSYRGHMLDVGRHFFPPEFIKKQIELLAYYKINVFRWHLTEDQGWRIEIKTYPNLTKVGAWRKEADGSIYGGFYTQEQIKDVVEYARVRNVMVIPEIEMPGHSTAALAAYPELSCQNKPLEVSSVWGVHKDIYCAGNEQTFTFLQNVLDEVIALFPAPYIHIGGDEVPKDRWKECPACQMLIKNEGLKDENGLQSYFIKRIQRYVESKGKTLIGWDEILEGGTDKNAVVEVWRGDAEGRKALTNGNRIISAGQFYFDTPPQGLKLKTVYDTNPVADAEYAAHRDLVLGAECPLWTENVTTQNAESMLYPRLQAFAETLWTGPARDYADFTSHLQAHYCLMDAWLVDYGAEDKNIAEYKIAFDPVRKIWRLNAERGMKDVILHYTSDGTEPTAKSASFTDSLRIKEPGVVKVAPFRKDRQYKASQPFTLFANKALGKPVKYVSPINRLYNKAGDMALVDGMLGSGEFNDGVWVGWQGVDLDAAVDLEQVTSFNSISSSFLSQSNSWIVPPKIVTFYISNDGANWTKLQTNDLNVDAMDFKPSIRKVEFYSAQPVTARFVRVQAVQYGKLPAGHNGAGGNSWIFADEIVVR